MRTHIGLVKFNPLEKEEVVNAMNLLMIAHSSSNASESQIKIRSNIWFEGSIEMSLSDAGLARPDINRYSRLLKHVVDLFRWSAT